MALPQKKKRPDDLALLAPEEDDTEELEGGEFEEDFEDEFSEDMPSEDPLSADMPPSIDPEQAQLCEQLGFTEPEQQQALLDLIKLVAAPAPAPNPSPAPMGDSLGGY